MITALNIVCALVLVICAAEIRILRNAIKRHRSASGMNRCWQNDDELYGIAGLDPCQRDLSDERMFLHECKMYYRGQCRES